MLIPTSTQTSRGGLGPAAHPRTCAMTRPQNLALKVSAVLWVIWGLVHCLAGIIVLSADAAGGVSAIADAVDVPVEDVIIVEVVDDYHSY